MVPIRVQSGRRRSRGCMSADFDTTPSDSLGCGRLPVGGQRRVEGVLPAVPRRRESAQWTSRSTTSRSASARNFAWTHPHGSTSTGCGMSRCFVDACRSPPTSHAGAHRPPTQVRTDLPQRRAPASRNGARRPLTQVRTDLSRRRAPTSRNGARRHRLWGDGPSCRWWAKASMSSCWLSVVRSRAKAVPHTGRGGAAGRNAVGPMGLGRGEGRFSSSRSPSGSCTSRPHAAARWLSV